MNEYSVTGDWSQSIKMGLIAATYIKGAWTYS